MQPERACAARWCTSSGSAESGLFTVEAALKARAGASPIWPATAYQLEKFPLGSPKAAAISQVSNRS